MKIISVMLVLFLMCGCGSYTKYSNLCNALYCNPRLNGQTAEHVVDTFGRPHQIEKKDQREIWTYEVSSPWGFGSKGKVKVLVQDGIVTDTQFLPAKTESKPQDPLA